MALFLVNLVFLLQPEATDAMPGGPGGPGPAVPDGGVGGCMQQGPSFVMLAVMFAVFYFLVIRPQQKQQKEVQAMLKALRKGDKVRTTGGIRGEIVELSDTDITLLVADKVKINVLRSHVASKVDKPASDPAKA